MNQKTASAPAAENKMGTMPIGKLLFNMSLPMMISMLVQALYNIVDSMFVAKLSESALTAVSLAFPVQNLMIAVGTGTGVGINALVSRSLGEKKQDEANTTVTHGLLLAFGIGALLNLLSLLIMKPYFRAFTRNDSLPQSGKYFWQRAGSVFDHIFSHSAVRSIWRQCIQRVTESKRIGADMAIKRKK